MIYSADQITQNKNKQKKASKIKSFCLSPQFTCAEVDLHKVRGSLEGLGMQIESAGFEFVSHNPISLDDEQMEEASVLIEALSDCPDVVRVWDNIQADS